MDDTTNDRRAIRELVENWAVWRDAGDFLPSPTGRGAGREGVFDAVHASAFPYAFPIVCARRLARRLRVPFFITPFLHLGDPDDPNDRTRRGYTSPALTCCPSVTFKCAPTGRR